MSGKRKHDQGALLILLATHREEFLGACQDRGLSENDARECLSDFEHEALSYHHDNEEEIAA